MSKFSSYALNLSGISAIFLGFSAESFYKFSQMLKKIIKFKEPTQKHKILSSRRYLNDFSLKAVFLFNGYFYATFSNIYAPKMPKIGSS